jgi:hypothetical protein
MPASASELKPMTSRTQLFESATGLVERVECRSPQRNLTAQDFSPDFQVAFPYRGGFVWHVGPDAVMSDPNQVLFVRGGEPFRVGGPRPDGFGEVIITPAEAILRDLSEAAGFDLERHPLFAARSRRDTRLAAAVRAVPSSRRRYRRLTRPWFGRSAHFTAARSAPDVTPTTKHDRRDDADLRFGDLESAAAPAD